MDAGAMTSLAARWKPVPTQEIFIGKYDYDATEIPARGELTLEVAIDTRGHINFVEHVQAELTLTFRPRGALSIYLTSPMGTRSTLLPLRPHDSKSTVQQLK